MAMKDLGTATDKVYDHPTSIPEQPKKIYPRLRLPMGSLGSDWKIGDKVVLEFEAKVVGINQDDYSDDVSFELIKGDAETTEQEAAEGEKE